MPDNEDVDTSASLRDLEYIRIAADSSNDIITIAASDAKRPTELLFLYANEGCARLFGYRVGEIVGSPVTMFDGPDTDRVALNAWLARAKLNETATAELLLYKKDRTPIWVELRFHATKIQDGQIVFVGVGRNISDRRVAQAKINELIRIDSLTGLFNRASLAEQLQAALDHPHFAGKMTAILQLDVDDFKSINELHGRGQGDKLRGFAESVVAAIAAAGLVPQQVVIEVTETAMFEPAVVLKVLGSLRASGIKVAFDDFGTGYSSLAWLQRLPKDIIKIDRSFIDELKSKPFEGTMADVIVMIGHRLGLVIVAEGVETREQAAVLRDHGCDLAQGYYYSPPVPAHAFEQMIAGCSVMGNAS